MTSVQAKAEVFWAAFRTLSKKERGAVVQKLVKDKEFREDLIDMVLLEKRRREPARVLEAYLADRRKKKK